MHEADSSQLQDPGTGKLISIQLSTLRSQANSCLQPLTRGKLINTALKSKIWETVKSLFTALKSMIRETVNSFQIFCMFCSKLKFGKLINRALNSFRTCRTRTCKLINSSQKLQDLGTGKVCIRRALNNSWIRGPENSYIEL